MLLYWKIVLKFTIVRYAQYLHTLYANTVLVNTSVCPWVAVACRVFIYSCGKKFAHTGMKIRLEFL